MSQRVETGDWWLVTGDAPGQGGRGWGPNDTGKPSPVRRRVPGAGGGTGTGERPEEYDDFRNWRSPQLPPKKA